MSLARISFRYAKSLIDLAKEENKLDRIYEDILNLKTACANRDFLLLCKSPIVSSPKKEQVFKALFEKYLEPMTFGFFHILIRKGRELYIPEIVHDFISQYEAINKKTKVTLSTAQALDEDTVTAIRSKLTSSTHTRDNIVLETKVNADLIGGFILEFDDRLYDASVAHQLRQMKKSLSNNDALKTI